MGNHFVIGLNGNSRSLCAVICSLLIVFALGAHMQSVSGAYNPRVLLYPTTAKLVVGQNLTIAVNLTSMPDLYTWQVVLEYNGSLLNLTDVVIPANNVFAGHTSAQVPPPLDSESAGDYGSKLNWTMVGETLLGPTDTANVTNGLLFEAHFTVIASGSVKVQLMTAANPIHTAATGEAWDSTYYTFLYDSNLVEYNSFQTMNFSNDSPQALFTTETPFVDTAANVVLNFNPSGAQNPGVTYATYVTLFNATASNAPVGHIITYIWNFGDGNVTTVNNTGPDSAYINHIFRNTGQFIVTLTVISTGKPGENQPLNDTYYSTALVGLVLPRFNWTPYILTIFGIFAALIVVSVVRSSLRKARTRRALKTPKTIIGMPPGQTPTAP